MPMQPRRTRKPYSGKHQSPSSTAAWRTPLYTPCTACSVGDMPPGTIESGMNRSHSPTWLDAARPAVGQPHPWQRVAHMPTSYQALNRTRCQSQTKIGPCTTTNIKRNTPASASVLLHMQKHILTCTPQHTWAVQCGHCLTHGVRARPVPCAGGKLLLLRSEGRTLRQCPAQPPARRPSTPPCRA